MHVAPQNHVHKMTFKQLLSHFISIDIDPKMKYTSFSKYIEYFDKVDYGLIAKELRVQDTRGLEKFFQYLLKQV